MTNTIPPPDGLPREFMFSKDVSKMLGFSPIALARWRKARVGPKWRRAVSWGRPLYYREDVEKLRDALLTIRGMKLRAFPNARGPQLIDGPTAQQGGT